MTVSDKRAISGVIVNGQVMAAILGINPAYPYPELAAAIKRAQGFSVPNPNNRLKNLRTVTLTSFELSSMPTGQYLVLAVIGEQVPLAEFRTMLDKVFGSGATLSVASVNSREEVPAALLPLYDRAFGRR